MGHSRPTSLSFLMAFQCFLKHSGQHLDSHHRGHTLQPNTRSREFPRSPSAWDSAAGLRTPAAVGNAQSGLRSDTDVFATCIARREANSVSSEMKAVLKWMKLYIQSVRFTQTPRTLDLMLFLEILWLTWIFYRGGNWASERLRAVARVLEGKRQASYSDRPEAEFQLLSPVWPRASYFTSLSFGFLVSNWKNRFLSGPELIRCCVRPKLIPFCGWIVLYCKYIATVCSSV